MPRSCYVTGCPGDSRKKDRSYEAPLSFFRVPTVISQSNKKFCGYGQEDRQRKVIELSKKRRNAWLRALRTDDTFDCHNIKVCGRHFIMGRPADLEDDDSPDWVPCLKLGYETDSIEKTKSAIRKHARCKLKKKKSEAIELYGGCSDPPVFIEAQEIEESAANELELSDVNIEPYNNFTEQNEISSIANAEPNEISTTANNGPKNNLSRQNDISTEIEIDSRSILDKIPAQPKEKYAHWHVHYCTKRACLESKVIAKSYNIDNPVEDR